MRSVGDLSHEVAGLPTQQKRGQDSGGWVEERHPQAEGQLPKEDRCGPDDLPPTDPLSLTPSLIPSVDEVSNGAPMSPIAGMRSGTSPDRYIR
jgi:hypothetical protein